MSAAVSPLRTLLAVGRGYRPRLFQGRGWVLAALPVLPVALACSLALILRARGESLPPALYLQVFHKFLVAFITPIMALVAAPAGVREDLEQRTLPLMLARPVPVWVLPAAKGLLWFAWGAVWLVLATLMLGLLGAAPQDLFYQAAALVGLFWGELALLSLFSLVFKRGTLWGVLYFIVDWFVHIFPGSLQLFSFRHYAESIAGSRAADVGVNQLLAQTQIDTPWPLALLILFAFGLLCWALCGWRLQGMPVGLAGADAEG